MHNLARAARRLGFISTFAALAVCAGPAAGSAMAGTLPSTTSVAASPDIIGSSGSSTVTATVSFAGVIAPTGTVTFRDESNGDAVLGTTSLSGSCVHQCTAQVVVTGAQLIAGQNEIRASYGGDTNFKPSRGVTFLYTPTSAGAQVSCSQFQFCQASGTSPDMTAALKVGAGGTNNAGGQTVLVSFSTGALSCSTPNTGDVGVFLVSDPTVPETVHMITFGAAGAAAQAAHPINAHGMGGHVCLALPTPFTTASGHPATLQPDGFYEGVLAQCVFDTHGNLTNPPCYKRGRYTDRIRPEYHTTVQLVSGSQGDPHMGP